MYWFRLKKEKSTKVIEELLWKDVLKRQTVLDYCKIFVILNIILQIINILFDFKISNMFIHLVKVLAYGILVIMLYIYFYKDINNIDKINIFTGFTFIFSVIETTDNLFAIFIDILGKGIINKLIKLIKLIKPYKKNDENIL